MKRHWISRCAFGAFLLQAVLLLGTSSAGAQPAPPRQLDQTALVHTWLSKDCGLGESMSIRDGLVRFGPAIEPKFIKAFQDGPNADEMKQLKESASARYRSLRETIDSGVSLGLEKSDLNRLKEITHDQFVHDEQVTFANRYRSRALAGLAVTGGREGKRLIEKVARDRRSPLQLNAQELLKSTK